MWHPNGNPKFVFWLVCILNVHFEMLFVHKVVRACMHTFATHPLIIINTYNTYIHITTSWGCWKHPFGIPGVRPMFLKPKLHKESKNGFKTINYRPSPVMIFSKNCFWGKKSSKKLDILLSFEFLWQNIWIN